MTKEYINYVKLIDDAMHIIVKKSLEIAATEGLQGDHHFFISFLTKAPGVVLPKKILDKYPEEMTIVLQYQFENLLVTDHKFSVTLSFSGSKEHIEIPFDALTAFADPSVKFGLQFRNYADAHEDVKDDIAKAFEKNNEKDHSSEEPLNSAQSNIIAMDSFRKRKKREQ